MYTFFRYKGLVKIGSFTLADPYSYIRIRKFIRTYVHVGSVYGRRLDRMGPCDGIAALSTAMGIQSEHNAPTKIG